MSGAVVIAPKFVERVWGSHDLSPLFGPRETKIGEVWYPAGPLLIKFLFTTEALSVQVHPDDEYAANHEKSRGKTEMWYILRAAPEARIALGFKAPVDADAARRAAEDGTIEGLLDWKDARTGDVFFTPAGTVHALGAGLVVCEIQQDSDVTYRLYDYGRGRELHLEKGFAVANCGCYEGKREPVAIPGGGFELVRCGHFVTEYWAVERDWICDRDGWLMVLEGTSNLGGPGTVARAEQGYLVKPEGRTVLLRSWVPEN